MSFISLEPIHVSDAKIPSILSKYFDADSCSKAGNKFCVVDGVTRDLRNDDVFKMPSNIREALYTFWFFPQNTLLRKASELCARSFTSSNTEELVEILRHINFELKRFNEINLKYGVNFLGNNLYGVVAAGGIIEDNELKCFNVADSNIVVLDRYFDVIHKTKDDYSDGLYERNKSMRDIYPHLSWNDNEYRAAFRSLFRNTDLKGSFGTLTGECAALKHIHYYNFNLDRAENIVAYTDGFKDIIEDDEKRKDFILNGKYKLEKEGTLIRYKKI